MNRIELQKVKDYLSLQSDKRSQVQLQVLQNEMSESDVFQKFVVEVSDEQHDEEKFFAARDAAQYLADKLTLAAFLPDAPIEEIGKSASEGTITLSIDEYNCLLLRLERLEAKLKLQPLKNYTTRRVVPNGDMLSQKEAIEYSGYCRTTLGRWVQRGLIHRYLKQGKSYFSKSELDDICMVAYKKHKTD